MPHRPAILSRRRTSALARTAAGIIGASAVIALGTVGCASSDAMYRQRIEPTLPKTAEYIGSNNLTTAVSGYRAGSTGEFRVYAEEELFATVPVEYDDQIYVRGAEDPGDPRTLRLFKNGELVQTKQSSATQHFLYFVPAPGGAGVMFP